MLVLCHLSPISDISHKLLVINYMRLASKLSTHLRLQRYFVFHHFSLLNPIFSLRTPGDVLSSRRGKHLHSSGCSRPRTRGSPPSHRGTGSSAEKSKRPGRNPRPTGGTLSHGHRKPRGRSLDYQRRQP